MTLSTAGDEALIQDLAVGETVEVMYTTDGAELTARTVTAVPTGSSGG